MNKIIIFTILLLSSGISFGQYDVDDDSDTTIKESKIDLFKLKERIYVGGDLSMSFGNQLYLYIAPLVGYDIYKGISAGFSPMYQLYRIKYQNGSTVSSHSHGYGIFGRWRPQKFDMLLLQTEFNVYNAEDFTTAVSGDRVFLPSLMGGLGYARNLGKSYYSIMLMYDFVNDVNNPLPKLFFNSPFYLRYGIVFYLG